MNLGGYFCLLDQAHYVDGAAAALCTKVNKIGFVAAKPIPIVLRTSTPSRSLREKSIPR